MLHYDSKYESYLLRFFQQRANYAVGLFVIIFTAACTVSAGREFNLPSPTSLQINETTKQDVLSRYGEPADTGTRMSNDHQIESITYSYSTNKGAYLEGVTPGRALNLQFFNDKLVGYHFFSSFREDHTDFDETLVYRIKKGEDSCGDVKKIFGNDAGEYVYPVMNEPTAMGISYMYSHAKIGFTKASLYLKQVIFTCDENGIVKDIEYSSSGQK